MQLFRFRDRPLSQANEHNSSIITMIMRKVRRYNNNNNNSQTNKQTTSTTTKPLIVSCDRNGSQMGIGRRGDGDIVVGEKNGSVRQREVQDCLNTLLGLI